MGYRIFNSLEIQHNTYKDFGFTNNQVYEFSFRSNQPI